MSEETQDFNEIIKKIAKESHGVGSLAELKIFLTKTFKKTQNAKETTRLEEVSWMLNSILAAPTVEISDQMLRPKGSRSLLIGDYELYIPLEGLIDLSAERTRIEEESERLRAFQKSVEHKLSNSKFVDNAPEEVVQKERQKLADAERSLEKLQAMLAELS